MEVECSIGSEDAAYTGDLPVVSPRWRGWFCAAWRADPYREAMVGGGRCVEASRETGGLPAKQLGERFVYLGAELHGGGI